jgi:hypothetical protein
MTSADACAVVGLPGEAPQHSDDRRSKKVSLIVLFCYVALPTVDTRTSAPPEEQATLHVSRPRPPKLWLPWHPGAIVTATSTLATLASRGYRLLEVHTSLYSSRNIRTLTTLRLREDLNPSAPIFGFYSSLIV